MKYPYGKCGIYYEYESDFALSPKNARSDRFGIELVEVRTNGMAILWLSEFGIEVQAFPRTYIATNQFGRHQFYLVSADPNTQEVKLFWTRPGSEWWLGTRRHRSRIPSIFLK